MVTVPLFIGWDARGHVPGVLLAASAVIAAAFFEYAFVSVWCFFAAFLAFYLCYIFRELQPPAPAL